MPFFLILPLWLLAVAVGAVMICTRRLRRAGIYVVTTSTFATLVSFALSTVVLFVGPRVTTDPPGWFGSVVLLVYLAAIPAGGLIGAIAGVLLTHKLLPKVRAP